MTEAKRVELSICLMEGLTPEKQQTIDALLEEFQQAAAKVALSPSGLGDASVIFSACMNLVMGLFVQAPHDIRVSMVMQTLELFQRNGADINFLGVATAPTLEGMGTSGTKH